MNDINSSKYLLWQNLSNIPWVIKITSVKKAGAICGITLEPL